MRTFFLIVLLVTGLFGAGELSNRRAPGFSLPDLHGTQHDPQDDRGKVVIVEIMQTTCPHCQKFTSILEQAKAKYKDQISIYSIVTLPDTVQMVQKYIVDYKVTGPILLDSGQVMASYMKVTPSNPNISFPHFFLIDRNGVIKNDYGYGTATANVFETTGPLFAEIDKLLGGK
jgi:thiol-disulfide isomerase/thioredoxin